SAPRSLPTSGRSAEYSSMSPTKTPPSSFFASSDITSLRYSWLTGSTKERSEEHTSELQSRFDLVCRLLLEKKKKQRNEGHLDERSRHSAKQRRPSDSMAMPALH